jgi:hypothetical protein
MEGEEIQEFQLSPAQLIEIQETWTTLKATRSEYGKKKRELALANAERDAASIRFWTVLEEMFPQTAEEGGRWKFNERKGAIERQEDNEPPNIAKLFGPFSPM